MKEWIRRYQNWFLALLACFALMMDVNADLSAIVPADGSVWSWMAAVTKKLEYILPVFNYKDAMTAFLVFFFFLKSEEKREETVSDWAYRVPAALTAFFLVFGYSFRCTNSWNLVFMDGFHLAVSAIRMVGFYVLAARMYRLLIRLLGHYAGWQKEGMGRAAQCLIERHAFWGPFLVILLFWLPYVIAKFPGAAMPEILAEMRQFYWGELNNYYPPLHTLTVGLLMVLGNWLHSYTFGFFLNLLLQLGLLLSAFSYGFVLMKRWRTPVPLRCTALLIICIVQFFPMEATVVEKDVPYTACVIFLVLQLYELVRTMETEKGYSGWKMLALVFTCMGVACSRNEGIYLVLASALGMCVYAGRKLWRRDRARCLRIGASLLLPVFLFTGYQRILLPACGVEDNGPKEALSIPFQQTARYVRDYGYELSAEDEEIISRVLDEENLAKLYDPITSDPVKYTYHAESVQDLEDYFGLWLRQLVRHPGNAVEATMNNAYGWFYQEGYAHNYMMTSRIEGQEIRWEINQPAALDGFRLFMERMAKRLSRVPVLNWFENAGILSWMTLLTAAVWLGSGRKRYLLSIVPLLMALLVCIAAPTFNYQMRYIMPVMFCVPFLAPMAVQSLRR